MMNMPRRIETFVFLFLIFYTTVNAEISCEKRRREVLLARRTTRSLHDDNHLPQCTVSGKFKSLQCRSDSCFCVDGNGKRVSEGMPVKRANSLSCSSKRNLGFSACELALQEAESMGPGSSGVYYPACNPDGTYQEMQCNDSTGYCWCVDVKTGRQLDWETRDKSQLSCE